MSSYDSNDEEPDWIEEAEKFLQHCGDEICILIIEGLLKILRDEGIYERRDKLESCQQNRTGNLIT